MISTSSAGDSGISCSRLMRAMAATPGAMLTTGERFSRVADTRAGDFTFSLDFFGGYTLSAR
jgi:hypothetical protein